LHTISDIRLNGTSVDIISEVHMLAQQSLPTELSSPHIKLDIDSSSTKEPNWNSAAYQGGAEGRKERTEPVCSSVKCVPNVDLELGALWQRKRGGQKEIH
jgi:hypothetical protein